MEESIIKKNYINYLKSFFDFDHEDYQDRSFVVTFSNAKYFVNSKTKKIDCYTEIKRYHEGFAVVKNENGYNYINENGELLSKKYFTLSEDFYNGFGQVWMREKKNFINSDGALLFEEFQDIITAINHFSTSGVMVVSYGSKPVVINSKGKKLFKNKFFIIFAFQGKNAVAIDKTQEKDIYSIYKRIYHIIDCDGNDLRTDFCDLEQISEDIFLAKDQEYSGIFLVNSKGKHLGNDYFDEYKCTFKNGCMLFRYQGKYKLVDKNGEVLHPNSFERLYGVYEDFAIICDNFEYHVLYYNKSMSNKVFKSLEEFQDFIATHKDVKKIEEVGVDSNSELLNNKNKVVGKYNNHTLDIYTNSGERIFSVNNFPSTHNGNYIGISMVPKQNGIKKINSDKKWFRYEFVCDGKKYSTKYKPVGDYGDIVVCEDNEHYYIFEKLTSNITLLGKKSNISLKSNYIIIDGKRYFVSGLNLIDVTALPFNEFISKKDGVESIPTYDDFKVIFNSPDYKEKLAAEMARLEELRENEERKRLADIARKKQEEETKMRESNKENLRKSLNNLSEILAECSKYILEIQKQSNANNYEKVVVPEELLLLEVEDHLEINPLFIAGGILRFIDLSNISFNNVLVSGIDLSYTNAHINPQEVYNKDMSNGKFCGLDFNLCSFEGVNISCADFKDATFDFAYYTEELPKRS